MKQSLLHGTPDERMKDPFGSYSTSVMQKCDSGKQHR